MTTGDKDHTCMYELHGRNDGNNRQYANIKQRR